MSKKSNVKYLSTRGVYYDRNLFLKLYLEECANVQKDCLLDRWAICELRDYDCRLLH
jgi:hypothetical protein